MPLANIFKAGVFSRSALCFCRFSQQAAPEAERITIDLASFACRLLTAISPEGNSNFRDALILADSCGSKVRLSLTSSPLRAL
jgi:hypothetical protein